ncbi:MAG TPA: GNAT family protein [Candidatus Limnocylindrales bacterium]|nr:GNAT family protein [Candidatus Limnocylindrales bacterium]
MRHSLHAEGFGVRLRPVRLEDAPFIVWLRNLEHVKGWVGDSANDVSNQQAWLNKYFEREGDYYFLVETLGGLPLGTHGIYNRTGESAEKGRHIVRPEVLAGVPAAMLANDLAFNQMHLTELRANAVSTNTAVLSLHRKCGFQQVGIARAAQVINGEPVDLVQWVLTVEAWSKVRPRLVPLAEFAGGHITEWEQSQFALTR